MSKALDRVVAPARSLAIRESPEVSNGELTSWLWEHSLHYLRSNVPLSFEHVHVAADCVQEQQQAQNGVDNKVPGSAVLPQAEYGQGNVSEPATN